MVDSAETRLVKATESLDEAVRTLNRTASLIGLLQVVALEAQGHQLGLIKDALLESLPALAAQLETDLTAEQAQAQTEAYRTTAAQDDAELARLQQIEEWEHLLGRRVSEDERDEKLGELRRNAVDAATPPASEGRFRRAYTQGGDIPFY